MSYFLQLGYHNALSAYVTSEVCFLLTGGSSTSVHEYALPQLKWNESMCYNRIVASKDPKTWPRCTGTVGITEYTSS
jgi:hypothetical protein